MNPTISLMLFRTTISILGLAFILTVAGQRVVTGQTGCALLDKKNPAQSLSFERLIDGGTHVVLRFRNNTDCDVTLLTYDPDPRAWQLTTAPDGTRKFRIAGPDDYPDGAPLEIKYHIEYQQPMPQPKKRIFIDEVLGEFRLLSGRSITFKVPIKQFDYWIAIQVPFRFDWDSAVYRPTHEAIFGNLDLPSEVFRKTKICSKVDWCKP